MNIRERAAKWLAPHLMSEAEIKDLVADEVRRVKMSLPVAANYDPKNEGYRPLMGGGNRRLRDLTSLDIDRMFEVAYWMWDHSAMTRRMAKMDKGFLFAEPITVTSKDDGVQKIIDRFWKDSDSNMDIDFPDQMMWLGILGEQCWPVDVNPHNGHVTLGYEDPYGIKDVYVDRRNPKTVVQVELKGMGGRSGRKMAVIRQDKNPRNKTLERLVGECFFFSINHPPDSPRGRSDYLTLFDWIDGLERYGFNYLERAESLMNYVWDITLKGATEDQIRDWLRDNPTPEPGSQRAHNENVEWEVVAPDIKSHDISKGFEMGKSFIMGSAGRPDSWYGGGGKAYQTEAEQFGQVPIKDLDERQLYHKHILTQVIQFAVDQAVMAGMLNESQAEAGFTVNVPEISKKDLAKLINGVPQLATALAVAETNNWIRKETAVQIFGIVMGHLGIEVDVQEEMEKARAKIKNEDDGVTEDYEE